MNVKLLLEENNANVVYDFLPEVKGNEMLLTLLFQNIFSGNVKFRKPDVNPVIKIYFEENEKYTTIKILNNGVGFNNKYSELFFEMFKRVNSNYRHRGFGLGLSIYKRIAEMHLGNIIAQS